MYLYQSPISTFRMVSPFLMMLKALKMGAIVDRFIKRTFTMCEEKESKIAETNNFMGLINRVFTNEELCIQDAMFYKFFKLLV